MHRYIHFVFPGDVVIAESFNVPVWVKGCFSNKGFMVHFHNIIHFEFPELLTVAHIDLRISLTVIMIQRRTVIVAAGFKIIGPGTIPFMLVAENDKLCRFGCKG
jgi:hypothetical protein